MSYQKFNTTEKIFSAAIFREKMPLIIYPVQRRLFIIYNIYSIMSNKSLLDQTKEKLGKKSFYLRNGRNIGLKNRLLTL